MTDKLNQTEPVLNQCDDCLWHDCDPHTCGCKCHRPAPSASPVRPASPVQKSQLQSRSIREITTLEQARMLSVETQAGGEAEKSARTIPEAPSAIYREPVPVKDGYSPEQVAAPEPPKGEPVSTILPSMPKQKEYFWKKGVDVLLAKQQASKDAQPLAAREATLPDSSDPRVIRETAHRIVEREASPEEAFMPPEEFFQNIWYPNDRSMDDSDKKSMYAFATAYAQAALAHRGKK